MITLYCHFNLSLIKFFTDNVREGEAAFSWNGGAGQKEIRAGDAELRAAERRESTWEETTTVERS